MNFGIGSIFSKGPGSVFSEDPCPGPGPFYKVCREKNISKIKHSSPILSKNALAN